MSRHAAAVHGGPIPPGEVGWALVYGLGYTAAVLSVAMIVFEKRDFQ